METGCNGTDVNGVPCKRSNWNPFDDDNDESEGEDEGDDENTDRRMMLGADYSYSYSDDDIDNGWWQGRVENLEFCVVLESLNIDPQKCDETFYTKELVYDESNPIVTGEAQYIAFGLFDAVADHGSENYFSYLEKKLNDNTTTAKVLNVINEYIAKENSTTYLKDFLAVGVSIGDIDVIVSKTFLLIM